MTKYVFEITDNWDASDTDVHVFESEKKLSNQTGEKLKRKRLKIEQEYEEANEETPSVVGQVNSFAEKLRGNLKGGHFRFLNEKLYKTNGTAAFRLFQESPQEFWAYHEGYLHQVKKWPFNPLHRIIKYVEKLPKQYVVADFGCGQAVLSKSVPHKVYSIDLVAANEDVIACDMAHTPLEKSSVDVAVFCLSLMGTNIVDFLLEANRVLKLGGIVHIAEIASRFEDDKSFVRKLQECGFQLVQKNVYHKLFYFFKFKKIAKVKNTTLSTEFSLKPCMYKKR